MNNDLAFWLSGSIVLFLIGLYGLITQKNSLKIIISIEFLVIGANSVFIGMGFVGNSQKDPLAQTYTLLSLGVGGSIIGLALAMITAIYQSREIADISELNSLRW